MSNYEYYVVESSFVVRVGFGTTERFMPDGNWINYPDRWDVLTNGRLLANEEKALEKAKQLFQLTRERDGGK